MTAYQNEIERHYRPVRHYDLQRVAKRLLWRNATQWKEQKRIASCCWNCSGNGVTVYRAKDGSRARFGGLVTCGSVWECIVCAQKISERRREELQIANQVALGIGYVAYFLTFTHPHVSGQALELMLEAQLRAMRRFKQSRQYRNTWERYGRLGSVRAREVTVSVLHGWHPHVHELVYAAQGLLGADDQVIDARAVRDLKRAWLWACLREGLIKPDGTLKPFRDFWRHGLKIQGGAYAADYIAGYGSDKHYGLAEEMTAGATKQGRRRGDWLQGMHFTPWQLLEWSKEGDAQSDAMFREYAAAFEGKRQLVWSPKLKRAFGILDLTDAELAEATNVPKKPEEEIAARLSLDQWGQLLRHAYIKIGGVMADSRAHLLGLARTYGRAGVQAFFEELDNLHPSARGNFLGLVLWKPGAYQ